MKLFIFLLCFIPTLVFGEVFSIVQMTDTHDTTGQKEIIYNNWILADINGDNEFNIKFVIHSGDLIQGLPDGDLTHLQASATAMKLLEDEVPYLIIPGNHDYDPTPPSPWQYQLNRTASQYELAYPESDFSVKSYFGDSYNNSMRNSYGTFTVDGKDYLVMGLEYCPDQTVLTWAKGVLDLNLDKDVILFTHDYFQHLAKDIVAPLPNGGCNWPEAFGGQKLYDAFVVDYPNIIFLLSGHSWNIDNNGSARFQNLVGDKVINQSRINFQNQAVVNDKYGFRILTMDTDTNVIIARTYNPVLLSWLTDSDNYFYVRTDRILKATTIEGSTLEGCDLN